MNRNVTAIILIVLAAGLYFTYTKGVIAGANSVKAVNDQYVTALDNASKLIKVRDKVRNDYNNLSEEDRDRLEKMIPSSVDNIRLVIDLNSVALRHGFSLKNVKAVASPSSAKLPVSSASSVMRSGSIAIPTLDTVNVSFSVNAPYQEFIRFLQDLESDLRIMDVTHLSVSTNDSGNYDYSMELKTYWLRQQ